ncbi:MAG: hypothetical protein AUI48_11895 [Chloroflexi bacterium 13_1_40CM_2_68_14]|nr:MAG: hypothetical protein AUI48_11895 [Chloroflexi bacterium 13_1_40CM_2_68_14]
MHLFRKETAMFKRALSTSLLVLSAAAAISATIVAASGISERVEAYRMTVLKTDTATGRFQCVEHLRWTPVVKADLRGLHSGDIVRVVLQQGRPARLVLLRTAAEEISSPEW